MAVSAEPIQDLRLDLLNLIEVYKDMLESVNPIHLLSEYATEEGCRPMTRWFGCATRSCLRFINAI